MYNASRQSSNGSTTSWQSQDTIRPGMTQKLRPADRQDRRPFRPQDDTQISPGTIISRVDIAPWETDDCHLPSPSRDNVSPSRLANHLRMRKDSPSRFANAIRRTPTQDFLTTPNQDDQSRGRNAFGRSISPDKTKPLDHRRPSVASASTVSSNGSKGITDSMKQKVHDLLADNNHSATQISSSTPHQAFFKASNDSRTNIRQPSPVPSRQKSPVATPSEEVTPWLYQENSYFNEITPSISADPDRRPRTNTTEAPKHSHKFHLHRPHRQNKSAGEAPAMSHQSPVGTTPPNQTESFPIFRSRTRNPSNATQSTAWTASSTIHSSTSPPSSTTPLNSLDGGTTNSRSDNTPATKRSLLGRFIKRKGQDQDQKDSDLRSSQSSSTTSLISNSLPTPTRPLTEHPSRQPSYSISHGNSTEESSPAQRPSATSNASQIAPKREHRLPFKSRRTATTGAPPLTRDPNTATPLATLAGSLWNLDTDLTDMEGIVTSRQQLPTIVSSKQSYFGKDAYYSPDSQIADPGDSAKVPAWDAPDSWAVRRPIGDQSEIDDAAVENPEQPPGPPFTLKLFRPDLNSVILSVSLNMTAAKIILLPTLKQFLPDEPAECHIIMRKHETSRQLDGSERPAELQQQLLEQAGYDPITDHIDEVGREDHSFLYRFTIMPAKMIGYASLEKDPGFSRMQKFSNIDLTGKNLITIPIALYQKTAEIVSLNLSRNTSLDVPKDFIQGCTILREIRYTANEAPRLPPSFALANKLTVLDVSNNRIDQLASGQLHNLSSLASLKLANNRITSIPEDFQKFKTLRSLNISSNFLTELPECLCQLKTLVDLDISFNSISALPHIGGLENLERLWANNNKLVGQPSDTVANLRNLREIDVRFNNIENIDVLSQLPMLEQLTAGHNCITNFEGSLDKLRTLFLDHNPVTRFNLNTPCPTLNTLCLASAKLSHLPDDVFAKMPGLTKLFLSKNHFATLPSEIGKLSKLDLLSLAKNSLSALPAEIGRLTELRFLDVRENNINILPSEIWLCRKLESMNLSCNVLETFPKPPTQAVLAGLDTNSSSNTVTPSISSHPSSEELDKLGEIGPRRMSTASGYLSTGSSPGSSHRKNSIASMYAPSSRKPSMLSRAPTESTMSTLPRKDSMMVSRVTSTFVGSLRNLYLADNRLGDEVFDQLTLLQEIRIVNLSYNELFDIPPRTIRRWQYLTELYLSGNDLTSLPAEDFEEFSNLKVLHINNNKFQVLPAELGKVSKLTILDAGSNSLKYNVTNWPYDWNWNWNRNLKYLNLSGNKRLEIKPATNTSSKIGDPQNLTDFSTLTNLRVLGLMDVTLMSSSVPDQSDDRRVRTSGSNVGSMAYGIADSLGRYEHLSTIDMIVPKLDGHEDETLIGLFDGFPVNGGGSRIAKFLSENFERQFKAELRLKGPDEDPTHALRRTYLSLNRQLATFATSQDSDAKMQMARHGSASSQLLNADDITTGAVATVLYMHGMELFVSNVGDAEAILIQSDCGHRPITRKHDPAEASERQRIRDAGGYVSKQGKLCDAIEVSRAFGFTQYAPAVIAAPYTARIQIQDSDEMILLASKELWDYIAFDFAVDLARSERTDLMRAAQKLRDLAIAFGAPGKIVVMLLGVSDLRRKERARYRTHSMSMGASGLPDEYASTRRGKRVRDATLDSKLARLDQEVEAPIGDVSLIFTDIKSSTLLWETFPVAMRAAIKQHNELMRRHLRIIGGYEVKTEGDAFMVAFPTVTSALLWAFTMQSVLLDVEWPAEILSSPIGQEVSDADGNTLFKGLSVRMGIHWGSPVCETDPVTRRMDYFGPMVNRAARISAVADGGQITVSSEFIAEVQRLLETHIDTDGRSNSTGSDDAYGDDPLSTAIKRELRSLSSHGFEVKDLGERRLKGLENPEYIYLMYPHTLAGRLIVQQERADAEKLTSEGVGAKSKNSQLTIDLDNVWDLWHLSLRLEMLCSAFESPDSRELKAPETALLERTRERGGEVTDRFLLNFLEHQLSRIETCVTSLALRNLVRPFKDGMLQSACPMTDIFAELSSQLSELKELKSNIDIDMAPS